MKTVIAILGTAVLIGGACAQSTAHAAGAASAPADSTAGARRSTAVEKHISEMHATLKITAAEEAQWTNVAQTMRDSAVELDSAIDKRKAMIGTATAPENLSAYGDVAQAHADGVKKLAVVFSPLYASMSDDQKKLADDEFAQSMHKHGK